MTGGVLLFVPGDRSERFAKAAAAAADAVIVDLEDAVAPDRKAMARETVREALRGGFEACVRINEVTSENGMRDLAMLSETRPAMVMVPKASGSADIAAVRDVLPGVPIVALIESIAGITALDDVAGAAGIAALAFGAYDLCAELGARATAEVLAPYRTRIVLAARRAAVDAIDTPYLDLEDGAGLALEAARAVDFGFNAKLAVHPKQVAAIRAAFVPSAAEVAEARAIVAAAAGGGVTTHGSHMIDAPVVKAALRVLDRAKES
jgi:citrate lyase beta subunit